MVDNLNAFERQAENIDYFPTAGSSNLVTSQGVEQRLALKQDMVLLLTHSTLE